MLRTFRLAVVGCIAAPSLFAHAAQNELTHAEVPFKVSGTTLCMKARVAGSWRWFAIDSGAWISWIDPAVVEGKDWKSTPNIFDPDLGPNIVFAPSIEIGGALLRNQAFVTSRRIHVGDAVEGTSEKIHGVIGFNVLRLLTMGLDLQAQRLWIWPPSKTEFARRQVFGSGNSAQLATFSVGSASIPTVKLVSGKLSFEAVCDLGAFYSFLSRETSDRLRNSLLGNEAKPVRETFDNKTRVAALLKDLRLGSLRWDYVPVLLGAGRDELFNGLGWTFLAPLGRLLLDFNGGALYGLKAEGRFTLKESTLSLYNASIQGDYLVVNKTQRMPLSWIQEFFERKLTNGSELRQSGFWAPTKKNASYFLNIIDPWKASMVIRYQNKEQRLVPTLIGTKAGHAPSGKNVPVEAGYTAPGFYFRINDKAVSVPPGMFAAPKGFGELVAVGCVPRIEELKPVAEYRVFQIPRIPERVSGLWGELGWFSGKSPLIIERDGKTTIARSNPPRGSAVAAAGRTLSFRRGVPVLSSAR